jgi:hypothetical protein
MPGDGAILKVSLNNNLANTIPSFRYGLAKVLCPSNIVQKRRKMDTTNGSPLGTNKETARNLLDVRIILAVLWVAGMLSSLNGDTYRLSDPIALRSMIDNTGPIIASGGLLLIMSMIFVGMIFMSVLTLTLKAPVSRLANRVLGILYAVIIFGFWVLGLTMQSAGYEMVWSTAQLVFALLVVWHAWKWTNPVIQPE